MKKLVINLTDEQYAKIQEHLSRNNKINAAEETFSGYSFNLNCTEIGINWLEVEMNTKIDVGEVAWKFA
ncbi:MAG TPA: hypothetical protein VK927_01290 [Adhaeribacter sp.]|nr:hypothetical protein [Adhaeribacter sp.]